MTPSPEAVVAMVNDGWDFNILMEMGAADFAFWADQQSRRNEELAKATKQAGKKRG